MSRFIELITSPDPAVRNRPLDEVCRELAPAELLRECAALEGFRHDQANLYHRVRALFFLYAICRFHLPGRLSLLPVQSGPKAGLIPFRGYEHLLNRRFEEAIEAFLSAQESDGPTDALCSALATAYHRLAFQTLADQVRRSVRGVRGNQWMFRMGHPLDHPLRLRRELLVRGEIDGSFPLLHEQTPVRMDLTHSAWSDIFFLGMDYPEGARVINVSIDLAVRGRDEKPRPPVEAFLRVIDEPVLRLTSVDLGATVDLSELSEVFDFARDHLGLLKAAVIASGVIPSGLEGSGKHLTDVLEQMIAPGMGLEIASNVRGIPKGSRLAVSTNLLGGLIALCMRATGQTGSLTGELQESERRLVAARAILGEWLGGSGGGWQDSGGVWPGMKLIEGVVSREGDPEHNVSRGRLLPNHHVFSRDEISAETRRKLQDSLVLVHGGMAQNVGPILEMVTEKYLLRSAAEWKGRQEALGLLEEVVAALKSGDVKELGAITSRNFAGPLQAIIPWASNRFTEAVIERVRSEFGDAFWGFWMLGGMSGGGMGFIFAPERKAEAQSRLQIILDETRHQLRDALPFAMEPVVYDFAINERGTVAELLADDQALFPPGYYTLMVPRLLQHERRKLPPLRRAELDKFGAACRNRPELGGVVQQLFDALLPRSRAEAGEGANLTDLLADNGFDRVQHEQIRSALRNGLIGLSQNRLPTSAQIEDVRDEDVDDLSHSGAHGSAEQENFYELGERALRNGEVAVVSLAAGAGSRWTQGAGVSKALHPFCKLSGRHRTFIETHLAKSRKTARTFGAEVPHVFTTSYLTHAAIESFLADEDNYDYPGPVVFSPGRSIGLRMVPMVRDLRFAWEEMPQQMLDERQQKVRDSLHAALIHWAQQTGEASDYTDNLPSQCLHPVGHWYEVPNLLRNGTLHRLLTDRPRLRHLMLHNIDTLGADLDPLLLGLHVARGGCLTFEVIRRRIEDRGGGLARVGGRVRLVEGLAMPREEDEFQLRFYNSMTTWIDIDRLLQAFRLERADLSDHARVDQAVREMAARMPTYITLKEVKKRWGHGQEDVFPVSQFEKLWGDMTTLADLESRFVVVPRARGQQLKDQAQLDGWLRDGSGAFVERLCDWG